MSDSKLMISVTISVTISIILLQLHHGSHYEYIFDHVPGCNSPSFSLLQNFLYTMPWHHLVFTEHVQLSLFSIIYKHNCKYGPGNTAQFLVQGGHPNNPGYGYADHVLEKTIKIKMKNKKFSGTL